MLLVVENGMFQKDTQNTRRDGGERNDGYTKGLFLGVKLEMRHGQTSIAIPNPGGSPVTRVDG